MSRMPENTFINGVHRYLPPLNLLHREKMANPYRGGTADWWYSARSGLDLWIEWKYIEVPVRDETLIDLRKLLTPLQQDWLNNRYAEGRNIMVGVGCKAGGVLFGGGNWMDPIKAGRFAIQVADRKTLADTIWDSIKPRELRI
jgi:hypothetical protein